MNNQHQTIIVTGASQGIGAGVVRAFLARGYNVVATSRSISRSAEFAATPKLVLVDGDIGDHATAARVVATAVECFGGVDGLVNNAGIFVAKPFIDYTVDDFNALVHTNLAGYLYITQLVVRQMLAQQRGGSVVGVTTSLLPNPVAGMNAAVSMMSKGGIDGVSRSLASEYAKEHIRFNLVAPGIVDTPMHKDNPKDYLRTLAPMGTISSVDDIANAIVYLTEARQVTGEVLHVDGGAHSGRW